MLIINNTLNLVNTMWEWLDNFLKYLDPSLFQNVIIAALAIFIPFIISHSRYLFSNNNEHDTLLRLTVFDVIIQWRSFGLHTMIGMFLFSFVAGIYSPLWAKIIYILAALYLIWLFSELQNILMKSRKNILNHKTMIQYKFL